MQLQQKTSAQFAVVTLKSLQGGEIDDFTNKLFAQWGVGEKGKNNGLMLLVALEDRKARIEVGYGLEPILPDALAGRVLDENLFPAFREHRYAQGLTQAVARAAEIVERGVPASPADRQKRNQTSPMDRIAPTLFLSIFVAIGFGAIWGRPGRTTVLSYGLGSLVWRHSHVHGLDVRGSILLLLAGTGRGHVRGRLAAPTYANREKTCCKQLDFRLDLGRFRL